MVADARPLVYPERQCSNLDGTHKVGYRDRHEAQRARRRLRVLDQRPYYCGCGRYHLGHRQP